jgi:hypothetical protein
MGGWFGFASVRNIYFTRLIDIKVTVLAVVVREPNPRDPDTPWLPRAMPRLASCVLSGAVISREYLTLFCEQVVTQTFGLLICQGWLAIGHCRHL